METKKYIWSQGNDYEAFIGRWSRLIARMFVQKLGIPAGKDWIDVGCGTGALSQTILDLASPQSVHSIDSAERYIEYARRTMTDPRITFTTGDAQSLPFESRKFDSLVSGLVLNFIPDQDKALREMKRVVRDGCPISLYVWDYSGGMQILRIFWDAAISLFPRAVSLDEGPRFPICHPEAIAGLFRAHDLQNIETGAIDVPAIFENFDDYWTPFLSGQGPAPGFTASLDDAERTKLRERVRSLLTISADGSFRLMARAWSVRGIK